MATLPSKKIRSTSLAARACINCRKRKSRCTGSAVDGQACSYCTKAGKECSFETPVNRTPLKRTNLDAAERRCHQLESLLRSLHSDLDIDTAIAQLAASKVASSRPAHVPGATGPEQVQQTGESALVLDSERGRDEEDETEEARYGWHEDFQADESQTGSTTNDALRVEPKEDGMGTFSTSDSGYLGSSSASSLLQEIAILLPLPNIAQAGSIVSPNAAPSHCSSSASQAFDRPDLASSAATSLFVDAYFLFYNTSYPIVYEKSFRAKAATDWRQNKKQSTWAVVYYMVLAIGHYVSATTGTPRIPSPFYTAARSRLSIAMLESASLETLQAFLLMGNYLQKRDRPNTGYNLIGIANRIAMGLGLHREPPNAVDNMLHERRRQLFWTVYCFDSGFNITTGRPPSVTEGFIDIRLPRNVDDRDCSLTSGVNVVDHPTPFSAIIAQAQLAKIADAIYREFLMAKTAGAKIPYQLADGFEQTLSTWRLQLPHYFVSADVPNWFLGPRTVVLWKFQNLRVLLWRGVERKHPFLPRKPEATHRCIEVATQAVHEISCFCNQFEEILHLGINWYATYFLFQATLILEACRLNAEVHANMDRELWQATITKSRNCLGILAKKSSSASRFLEVLDRIHEHNFPVFSVASQTVGPEQDVRFSEFAQTAPMLQDESYLLDEMFGSFPGDPQTQLGAMESSPLDFNADPTIRMLIDQMPFDFPHQTSRDFYDG